MGKHAVSADRVVNIDETSCRCIRLGGAAAASKKLSCKATRRKPRHSRSPSAWTVACWTCWCRSCARARQTPSCRSSLGKSRLITSRQRTASLLTTSLEIATSHRPPKHTRTLHPLTCRQWVSTLIEVGFPACHKRSFTHINASPMCRILPIPLCSHL